MKNQPLRLLLLVLIQCFVIKGMAQDVQSAPIIDPFNLGKDNLGAISNSVNLFTGDVSLPMSLISIPGREDISINLSAMYSSANIENVVSVWNLDAPTGVIGLGWTLQQSQITVDNNQTAAREDDIYYLQENGNTVQLICTGINGGVRSYKTKRVSNKVITYTSSTERWDIIQENGTRYIYGNTAINGGSAIQWTTFFGNWIGNTNQSTLSRQGLVWNLSQKISVWGDLVTYNYNKSENSVGSGVMHTEASYLSTVIDSFGHEVDLVYGKKLAEEVMEPHTEQNEPDAFQERYENMYLDKILVRGDGAQYYEIDFKYTFYSAGSLTFGNNTKRLLASIMKVSTAGLQSPATKFAYLTSGPMAGAMSSVTTPNGGSVSFEYTPGGFVIPKSATDLTITAPAGYAEPRVFPQENYTVVTWRKLLSGNHDQNAEPIQVYAYSWNGEWVSTNLSSDIPSVQVKQLTGGGGYADQDFLVTTQKNFFALLAQDYSNTNFYYVYIWYKNENDNNKWTFYLSYMTFASGSTPANKSLFSGNNFVAVSDNYGNIFRYVWNGGTWNKTTVTESAGTHATFATDNYIISHNLVPSPDQINFYYLNETGTWSSAISMPCDWDSGSSPIPFPAYWSGSNSHAVVFPSSRNGFIYQWDNNYSNFTKVDKGFNYQSVKQIYMSESTLGIQTTSNLARAYRFNGNDWIDSGEKSISSYNTISCGFGDDMFLWYSPSNYSLFGPNTNSWQGPGLSYSSGTNVAGFNYYIYNSSLYYHKQDGSWNQASLAFPWADGAYSAPALPNYFINNGYIFFLKNGIVSGNYNLATETNRYYHTYKADASGSMFYLNGVNSVVLACNYTYFYDCTSLTLLRIDPKSNNLATFRDYPIDKITINDGLRNYFTSFKYEYSTAMTDPSRSIAQYNMVTSVQGSADANTTPFGYTQTYFFNGISDTELGDAFPNQNISAIYSASSNYKLLTGQVYRTKKYDASQTLVSQTDISFTAYLTTGYNGAVAFSVLTGGTSNTIDGVMKRTDYNYNVANQVSHQQDYTVSGTNQEIVDTYVTYGWEIYPNSLQAKNMLHLPYKISKSINNVPGTNQLTRYNENFTCTQCQGTIPVVYDQYTSTGSGVSTPPSNIGVYLDPDWYFQGMVSGRDATNGVEMEWKGKGLQYKSVIYDNLKRSAIASVSNAPASLVAYTSFEDAGKGNWSWSDGSINSGSAKTGNNYYSLGSGGMTKAGLNTYETYRVTFWAKTSGGSVTISGVGTQSLGTLSGWTLFQYTVSNQSSVTISLNGSTPVLIDEVSVVPNYAIIQTSTFHPIFGPTSKTDENGHTGYILYDGLGRTTNTVDEKSNILSNIIYNYQK
jgi:hypothetical protein